jgi:predicted molibdopterin-dependent oxidoreductase YjgC
MLTEHLPSIIIYGSGVTHYPTASDTIQAIGYLASLVGNVGVIGVPGEGNFVGAHDMGAHPARLPGYRRVSDPEARAFFNTIWGVLLNPTLGRSYEAVLAGIRQGEIKALYLAGEVPPLPELSNLSFLVVQDILATENTQYAHAVLPATTFAEMDGTLTNLEGRVQHLYQAIPPVGLSRPGWMIVRDVAKRVDARNWDYSSAAEVMVEISALVQAYRDVNYQTLGVNGVLRRFEPAAKAEFGFFGLGGVPRFATDELPLTLITERNLFYYHGACLTEQVKGMNLIKQEDVLHLSQSDASRLGITNEAVVKVVSPYGDAKCLARVSNSLPDGIAFISVNRVVGSSLFPTLVPGIKACAVRVEVSDSTIGV